MAAQVSWTITQKQNILATPKRWPNVQYSDVAKHNVIAGSLKHSQK